LIEAPRAPSLPVGFLTRLIWREIVFALASSARRCRGHRPIYANTAPNALHDPFDPDQAIQRRRRCSPIFVSNSEAWVSQPPPTMPDPPRVAAGLKRSRRVAQCDALLCAFVTRAGADTAAATDNGKSRDDAKSQTDETCLAVTAELRRSFGSGADDDLPAPLMPWVCNSRQLSKSQALAVV